MAQAPFAKRMDPSGLRFDSAILRGGRSYAPMHRSGAVLWLSGHWLLAAGGSANEKRCQGLRSGCILIRTGVVALS